MPQGTSFAKSSTKAASTVPKLWDGKTQNKEKAKSMAELGSAKRAGGAGGGTSQGAGEEDVSDPGTAHW